MVSRIASPRSMKRRQVVVSIETPPAIDPVDNLPPNVVACLLPYHARKTRLTARNPRPAYPENASVGTTTRPRYRAGHPDAVRRFAPGGTRQPVSGSSPPPTRRLDRIRMGHYR